MTIVVLSPHLDDAVLSVAGTIRRAVRSGERAIVLTVFSDGDASYAARRDEDRAACEVLGCEAVHLGLLDAPFRLALPRSFASLVMTPLARQPEDGATVHPILSAAIAQLEPRAVLLPLGVGDHLDHRVVHEVHRLVRGSVGFYEDRPYAMVRHAALRRLLALGAEGAGDELTRTPRAAEEFTESALAAAHVRAYLPAAEREPCLRQLAQAFQRPPPPASWTPTLQETTFRPAELPNLLSAMRAYASQLSELFGSEDLARALCSTGRYTERIHWRAGGPELS